jgi:hypothetical protein
MRKRPAKCEAFTFGFETNYLVGDGFAVFDVDELLVVVVDDVFERDAELLEFIAELFIFDDGAVVVVEDELVTVVETAFEFAEFMFERLVLVLLAVSPPHAAPIAAKPKSAESAIAFFILKTISCLSQRLI